MDRRKFIGGLLGYAAVSPEMSAIGLTAISTELTDVIQRTLHSFEITKYDQLAAELQKLHILIDEEHSKDLKTDKIVIYLPDYHTSAFFNKIQVPRINQLLDKKIIKAIGLEGYFDTSMNLNKMKECLQFLKDNSESKTREENEHAAEWIALNNSLSELKDYFLKIKLKPNIKEIINQVEIINADLSFKLIEDGYLSDRQIQLVSCDDLAFAPGELFFNYYSAHFNSNLKGILYFGIEKEDERLRATLIIDNNPIGYIRAIKRAEYFNDFEIDYELEYITKNNNDKELKDKILAVLLQKRKMIDFYRNTQFYRLMSPIANDVQLVELANQDEDTKDKDIDVLIEREKAQEKEIYDKLVLDQRNIAWIQKIKEVKNEYSPMLVIAGVGHKKDFVKQLPYSVITIFNGSSYYDN